MKKQDLKKIIKEVIQENSSESHLESLISTESLPVILGHLTHICRKMADDKSNGNSKYSINMRKCADYINAANVAVTSR